MGYATRFVSEDDLLYVRYAGEVRAEEIREAILGNADAGLGAVQRRLHDFREAAPTFATEELRRLVEVARGLRDRIDPATREQRQTALVVPDDRSFGFGRMFGSLVESTSGRDGALRVFRSVAEATEWLGLGADYPDPGGARGRGRGGG